MKLGAASRRSTASLDDANSSACRLVLHAGFAKCGSSSIQGALFRNFAKLRQAGVRLFDKNLHIAKNSVDLAVPIWALEAAKKTGAPLAESLAGEIISGRQDEGCLAILSAENLATPGMAELFAGLDGQIEVALVFYVRPPLEWIPSAWTQWGIKQGMSLDEYVARCLKLHRPAFRENIEAWQKALPGARLHVRFLIPELLEGANPAEDFFRFIGLDTGKHDVAGDPRNPSLDFSILHALSKNPQLFSGPHDNRLTQTLQAMLPKKFQATNIRMLSAEQETRIEEYFREENRWLLGNFCRGRDVEEIYDRHFTPKPAERRYSDVSEAELASRCLTILLETLASK